MCARENIYNIKIVAPFQRNLEHFGEMYQWLPSLYKIRYKGCRC